MQHVYVLRCHAPTSHYPSQPTQQQVLGGALYSYLPAHDAYTILTLPLIVVVLGLTAFLLPLQSARNRGRSGCHHLFPSLARPRVGRAQASSSITSSCSSTSSTGSVDGGPSSSMLVRLGGKEQRQRLELVVLRDGDGDRDREGAEALAMLAEKTEGDEEDEEEGTEDEEEEKDRGDAASVLSSSSSSAALASLAAGGGGVRVWTDPTVGLIALAITLTFASQGFLALSFGVHTRNVLGLSRWVFVKGRKGGGFLYSWRYHVRACITDGVSNLLRTYTLTHATASAPASSSRRSTCPTP